MTRYLALLLVCVAMSVLATGCGPEKDKSPSDKGGKTANGDNNGAGDDKTGAGDNAGTSENATGDDEGSPTGTAPKAGTDSPSESVAAEKKGGALRGLGRALLKGASGTLSGESTD